MTVSVGVGSVLQALSASLVLGMAACSTAGPDAPTAVARGEVQQTASGVCDAGMIDSSTNPPHRFSSPTAKWVIPPDTRFVAETLSAAAPDKRHPIREACGVIRFVVTANGTVQNITVLAEYPQGIGLGDAWLKYMAPVVYPPSAAGGPYAAAITLKAHRVRLPG